jgi:hypothetical protein
VLLGARQRPRDGPHIVDGDHPPMMAMPSNILMASARGGTLTTDSGWSPAAWRVVRFTDFVDEVRAAAARCDRVAGPRVLAVDGHSASGKTTLADRLAAGVPGGAVLHTDDVAWHHSVFDWDELLVQGVLAPLRRGAAVAFRPPAWQRRGRPGAIVVPAGTTLLVVEGVGSSRASLAGQLDLSIWVETAEPVRVARDDVRLARGDVSPPDFASWMAEENAFVASDRPWDRARWIVSGTPQLPHDPADEVVIAGS